MQGGGQRGYRVDAETAAGGGLVPVTVNALTRNGITGTDDNTAQGGQLVTMEPEAYQVSGAVTQRMGALRRGNGNETGGVPFIATTLTAREGKGPDSDATTTLVGVDLAQVTSGQNRSNPQPGDPQPTLAAGGQASVAYALRRDPGGTGQGHNTNYVVDEPAVFQGQCTNVGPMGALRAGNGNETGGVPFTVSGAVTHALTSEGADASEDGTGRGTPVIAFGHTDSVGPRAGEQANTVRSGHNTGGGAVSSPAAVRRLTPVECERLQGYPDGWTAISAGREQSDSARYRQLGNSIAVPVFTWVAGGIAEYELSTIDRERE